MAFRISRKSLRSSASRLRTMVTRIMGSAAPAKMRRMVQAMISSRRVMPASAERLVSGNSLDGRIRCNCDPLGSEDIDALLDATPLQRGVTLSGCHFDRQKWLRGLDSNQDSQLQRLVSYQLDDPGVVG